MPVQCWCLPESCRHKLGSAVPWSTNLWIKLKLLRMEVSNPTSRAQLLCSDWTANCCSGYFPPLTMVSSSTMQEPEQRAKQLHFFWKACSQHQHYHLFLVVKTSWHCHIHNLSLGSPNRLRISHCICQVFCLGLKPTSIGILRWCLLLKLVHGFIENSNYQLHVYNYSTCI